MSSRVIEKEHRREERIRQEGEQAAHERRSRRLVVLGLLLAGALTLTAIAVPIGSGGNASAPRAAPTAQDGAAFGPHCAGLVQRREAAGLPTMMDTLNSPVHFHPSLKVFVNGKPIPVPANIGIDPNVDPMQMAGLHTHDASGTIHVEGVAGARLGQFFAVWGVPLSARQLGPYKAGTGRACASGSTANARPRSARSSSPTASTSS